MLQSENRLLKTKVIFYTRIRLLITVVIETVKPNFPRLKINMLQIQEVGTGQDLVQTRSTEPSF